MANKFKFVFLFFATIISQNFIKTQNSNNLDLTKHLCQSIKECKNKNSPNMTYMFSPIAILQSLSSISKNSLSCKLNETFTRIKATTFQEAEAFMDNSIRKDLFTSNSYDFWRERLVNNIFRYQFFKSWNNDWRVYTKKGKHVIYKGTYGTFELVISLNKDNHKQRKKILQLLSEDKIKNSTNKPVVSFDFTQKIDLSHYFLNPSDCIPKNNNATKNSDTDFTHVIKLTIDGSGTLSLEIQTGTEFTHYNFIQTEFKNVQSNYYFLLYHPQSKQILLEGVAPWKFTN